MSLWRQAARTDANQGAIVDALRQCGYIVEITRKPVDLLVGDVQTGRWYPLEVKVPGGTITDAQERLLAAIDGRLPLPIIDSPEAAIEALMRLRAPWA